jgi:hypothetical protein
MTCFCFDVVIKTACLLKFAFLKQVSAKWAQNRLSAFWDRFVGKVGNDASKGWNNFFTSIDLRSLFQSLFGKRLLFAFVSRILLKNIEIQIHWSLYKSNFLSILTRDYLIQSSWSTLYSNKIRLSSKSLIYEDIFTFKIY